MRWVNPKFLRVVFARRINNVNVTEAVVLLVGVAKVAVRINAKFTADLFVRSDVVVIFFFFWLNVVSPGKELVLWIPHSPQLEYSLNSSRCEINVK